MGAPQCSLTGRVEVNAGMIGGTAHALKSAKGKNEKDVMKFRGKWIEEKTQ